jgi:hypothetical protein
MFLTIGKCSQPQLKDKAMRTIRLGASVICAMRNRKTDASLGDGTMAGIVSRAIRLYRHKHAKCFECSYHKEILAGLELARQKLAMSGCRGDDSEYVGIRPKEVSVAKELACQGKSLRQVVEQALLEHVTRPKACDKCPFYGEMCQEALVSKRRVR